MKYINFTFILMTILSCSLENNHKTTYYYVASRDSIFSYGKTDYYFSEDTLIESSIFFYLADSSLERNKAKYLVRDDSFFKVVNKRPQLYLSTIRIDTCIAYHHPMRFDVLNCYLGSFEYKGYREVLKYTTSQQVIDGTNMTIYRDIDFALIEQVDNYYDSYHSVRIQMDSIPEIVLKNLNSSEH
jgi:hypothetical protein